MQRHKKRNSTHQVLLDVSEALFLDKGYGATTVGDIAKAAGVSRVTFYANFASKHAVLRELATKVWDSATAGYMDFAKLPDWTEDSIAQWLDSMLDIFIQHGKIIQLLITTLYEDLTSQDEQRKKRNIAVVMGASERWSHLSPGEAERRVFLLIFQLERAFAEWDTGRWKIDRELFIRTMATVWLATLRAPREISKKPQHLW